MREFRCVRCRQEIDLLWEVDSVICPACQARFPLLDGSIPNFIIDPGRPENFLGPMFTEDAAQYDERYRIEREHGAWVLEQLAQREPRTTAREWGRAVEIGAGTGPLTRSLASKKTYSWERLYVTDLSPEMLVLNRRQRDPAEPEGTVRYLVCNSLDLPLPDNSVDAILGMDILHHILDYPLALKEFHRVLTPGGFCAVKEPHRGAYQMFRFFCHVLLTLDTPWLPFWGLTPQDRTQLRNWKDHLSNLMAADDRHDLAVLSRVDDKYFFDPKTLEKKSQEAGFSEFSECNILYRPELQIPYGPMVLDNFKGLGLSPRGIQLINELCKGLDETIGQQMLEHSPVNTMFLFWK